MSHKSGGHFAHAQTVCTRPLFRGLVARLVASSLAPASWQMCCLSHFAVPSVALAGKKNLVRWRVVQRQLRQAVMG